MKPTETLNKLAVLADTEIEAGLWHFGAWYYVRTPTLHYTGRLVAVSASVLVLDDVATVYESGALTTFFGGKRKGRDEQPHVGGAELILDRAGCHAMRMPAVQVT